VRAAVLRVRADAVEDVLDVLLPDAPRGVHERPRGDVVELICCEPPAADTLLRAAGDALIGVGHTSVPDDDVERRAWLYEPQLIAGRFHLRPAWAPGLSGDGVIELVLQDAAAFGTGAHPTTRMCLAALTTRPPGPLADLGCGTGVLAVAAALLGYAPVSACDVSQDSVASARATAGDNGATVDVTQVDLLAQPPPAARLTVANVPLLVHEAIAPALDASVQTVLASGLHAGDEAGAAAALYAAAGLHETAREHGGGWALLTLERAR
jgi:ribosomal protein L11 methyltransferase